MAPNGIQMATWSNIGCGSRKKSVRVRCGSRAGPHVGSQMGAKLEPNGVKMAFEIASKFANDFEMFVSSKKVPKRSQHGSQNRSKMEPKSFQEATSMQRLNMPKVLYSLQKIVFLRVSGRRLEMEIRTKNRIRIAVNIKIDSEVNFRAKIEPKSSPKGAQMDAKLIRNRC